MIEDGINYKCCLYRLNRKLPLHFNADLMQYFRDTDWCQPLINAAILKGFKPCWPLPFNKDNFASKMCHILSGTGRQPMGFRTLEVIWSMFKWNRRGYAYQYTGYYTLFNYFRRFSLSKLKENLEKEISIGNVDGFKLKIVWCRGQSKGDGQALTVFGWSVN